MKKLKDFGSFVSEGKTNEDNENKLNENMWTELFSNASTLSTIEQVYYWLGITIDTLAVGLIGKNIIGVATSGAIELLKNNKLGERGKEFADIITKLGQKGASLFKRKGVDTEVVDEVNVELKSYGDIIDRLHQGELGEEGINLAKKVDHAIDAADEV